MAAGAGAEGPRETALYAAVKAHLERLGYEAKGEISLLLTEHRGRQGDPAVGGASYKPVMTAYRQRALACVVALRKGPRRPRDLREAVPDAADILLRNIYGWFEREARGVYRLSPAGDAALLQ